jgi:hypothetical protein
MMRWDGKFRREVLGLVNDCEFDDLRICVRGRIRMFEGCLGRNVFIV